MREKPFAANKHHGDYYNLHDAYVHELIVDLGKLIAIWRVQDALFTGAGVTSAQRSMV